MIVEWNAHMFSSNVERFPFHAKAAYQPEPARQPEDPLANYLGRMEAEGIDRAVLVHPEPYGDDHRLVLECLARVPDRLRATALFYPKDADAPQRLKELIAEEPGIVGFRFHAHRGKEMYLNAFSDRYVVDLWETAGSLGLVIELHIGPNYAAQVSEVIADHPDFPVLVDHLAEPGRGSPEEYEDVLRLAEHGNVMMKLSGLGHISDQSPLFEDARPLTRRVAEAFGPNRLVWGGGTPEIVDVHLDAWNEDERARVKGGNLAELLNLS